MITRTSTFRVTEEILILAEQQLETIQSRFPQYECKMWGMKNDHRLRVEIVGGTGRWRAHLIIFFSDSSADIWTPYRYDYAGKPSMQIPTSLPLKSPKFIEEIDYTDPRFTVDFISDMLERLRR